MFWLFAGPALLLASLSMGAERRRAARFSGKLAARPARLPSACVIVPAAAFLWLGALVSRFFKRN